MVWLACTDKVPRFRPPNSLSVSSGGLGAREHGAGLVQEHLARLGQLDAPPYPLEKLRLVACLQRRDGMARRRLREIEGVGCLGDVLALGDRDEDPELLKGHGFLAAPRRQPDGGSICFVHDIMRNIYWNDWLCTRNLRQTPRRGFAPRLCQAGEIN